jgi:hypothetical protein
MLLSVFLKIVKVQFNYIPRSIDCSNNIIFFVLIKFSLVLKPLLLLDFMNMLNFKISFTFITNNWGQACFNPLNKPME